MTIDSLKRDHPDACTAIYNQGVIEGLSHAKPSPETQRRLEAMERKMEEHSKVHTEVLVTLATLKDMPQALEKVTETLNTLSTKVTELSPTKNIVYGAVALILTVMGTAILALVVKS